MGHDHETDGAVISEASMIQSDELRHIAKLARLELSESELATYTRQVDEVLQFFGQLHAIDTSSISGRPPHVDDAPRLRSDDPAESLCVQDVLREAASTEGEYFQVPRILDA